MPVCFNPPCSHSCKTLISPGASAIGLSRSTDYRRSGVYVYSVSYTVLYVANFSICYAYLCVCSADQGRRIGRVELVRVLVVVLDLPPWAVDEEGIVCVWVVCGVCGCRWVVDEEGIVCV